MPVFLVLTVSAFVLPRVFATHAARILSEQVGGMQKLQSPEAIKAYLSDPERTQAVRLAYRWGLTAGLISLIRWPLALLTLVLILV